MKIEEVHKILAPKSWLRNFFSIFKNTLLQAAHDPYQAPEEWIEKFHHIEDQRRRKLAAMISYLDHSVGRVRFGGIVTTIQIVFEKWITKFLTLS